MKRKVLISTGYYIPSVKGGGPIQSIKNLVDNLSEEFDFYILASDRDLGDDHPFKMLKTDDWVQVGNAKVFYTNSSKLSLWKTSEILNSITYDVLYLNSFFDYKFSIAAVLLRKLKWIPSKSIVLAPRGEFSLGALGLKNKKKKLYIKFVKGLNLYKGIIWHATAENEKKDIEDIFGERVVVKVANNLTANYSKLRYDKTIDKTPGELKVVFVSRISPKKNLKMAVELLKKLKGKVQFTIYGPIEDKDYWIKCEQAIAFLPQEVKVIYKGLVEHDEIISIFKEHHVFLLPTLGENFGHVISEALIGGCPVIISDQTPWRELEEVNVGWDISLNDEDRFVEVLQHCVDMNQEQYSFVSRNAFEFGKKESNKEKNKEAALKLIRELQL